MMYNFMAFITFSLPFPYVALSQLDWWPPSLDRFRPGVGLCHWTCRESAVNCKHAAQVAIANWLVEKRRLTWLKRPVERCLSELFTVTWLGPRGSRKLPGWLVSRSHGHHFAKHLAKIPTYPFAQSDPLPGSPGHGLTLHLGEGDPTNKTCPRRLKHLNGLPL